MEIEDYKKKYSNFEIAANQTALISLAAGEVLKEFPKKLPKETRDILSEMLSKVAKEIKRLSLQDLTHGVLDTKSPDFFDFNNENYRNPFFVPTLQLYIFMSSLKQDTNQLNFDNLLYAQELIMLFSHLDAFISDSIGVMCRREPRLLIRDKKMSWKNIIENNNWENLFEKMNEEYSYDIGWKSTKEKVQYLHSEHGLSIATPSNDLDEIESAEQIRHIVIHDGNRVSQEYLNRTKRTDVNIGDIIPITADYVHNVNRKVQILGSDIFCSIAEKFFQINTTGLTGILRRETQATNESI